jgi:hypothetical protein
MTTQKKRFSTSFYRVFFEKPATSLSLLLISSL